MFTNEKIITFTKEEFDKFMKAYTFEVVATDRFDSTRDPHLQPILKTKLYDLLEDCLSKYYKDDVLVGLKDEWE